MTQVPPPADGQEDAIPGDLRAELDALATRHRADPPVAVLRAAEADALPAPTQRTVAAALAASPWQQRLVAGANEVAPDLAPREVEDLLARIHREGDAAAAAMPMPSRRWRLYVPILSASALAVLIATVVWPRTAREVIAPPEATVVPPVVPVPAPAFHIPIEPAAVKLTASALVRRSAGETGTFTDDAATAFAAYRAADYAAAAAAFARLESAYPAAPEVPFYLGVSRLLSGDVAGARTALIAARRLDDPTFRDDVAWYRAAADERAGDRAAARAALTTLCQGPSAYAARACAAVAHFPQG